MRVDQIHPGDTKSIEAVPGVIVNPATDHEHVTPSCCSELDHRTDHLAVEGGRVNPALPGNDQISLLDLVVELNGISDQGRTRLEPGPSCDKPASEASRRSPADDTRNIDTVLGPVDVNESLEPSGEQANLGRACAFLRPEHPSGIGETGLDVTRDDQVHPTQPRRRRQGPKRAKTAVGRR